MTAKAKLLRILISLVMASTTFSVMFGNQSAFAADSITSRSLTLEAINASSDGGSKPGGTVNHKFTFTLANTTDQIQSILFQYCTTAYGSPLPSDCTPADVSATGATIGTGTGMFASGWTLDKSNPTAPFIKHAAVVPSGAGSIVLSGMVNPAAANGVTFYVRIKSFTANDGATGPKDSGAVAASTAMQIILTGHMPESLIFCTGATIDFVTSTTIPDCSKAYDSAVGFTSLFSPTATATATSQMAASTNAGTGYAITVNGPANPLVNGSSSITGMTTRGLSMIGTNQFGMNLIDNATPNVGALVSNFQASANYRGQPTTDYGTLDEFKYVPGESIAQSNYGGNGPTDGQRYTISYIVNVPGSLAAGDYQATLTFICTPTF
jgi:hypothetical protein